MDFLITPFLRRAGPKALVKESYQTRNKKSTEKKETACDVTLAKKSNKKLKPIPPRHKCT